MRIKGRSFPGVFCTHGQHYYRRHHWPVVHLPSPDDPRFEDLYQECERARTREDIARLRERTGTETYRHRRQIGFVEQAMRDWIDRKPLAEAQIVALMRHFKAPRELILRLGKHEPES
jgi:hypothetical protein